MSRLYGTITESSSNTEDKFEDIIKVLMNDCLPFIKDISKSPYMRFMYSGRKNRGDYYIDKIRNDRRPADTHKLIHYKFDDAFKKRFGWPARSNSIFTTGDNNDVSSYGTPYMIFPMGNYKVLWSKEVPDLYIKLQRKADETNGISKYSKEDPMLLHFATLLKRKEKANMPRDIQDRFEDYYDEMTADEGEYGYWTYEPYYANVDDEHIIIPKTLKKRDDVLKWIKKEHGVEPGRLDLTWYPSMTYDEFWKKFYYKWIDDKENSYIERAQAEYDLYVESLVSTYKSGDIVAALDSENEIMLNCSKYLAINEDWYSIVWAYLDIQRKHNFKLSPEAFDEWWIYKGRNLKQ